MKPTNLRIFALVIITMLVVCGCFSSRSVPWQDIKSLDYAYDQLLPRDTMLLRNIKAYVNYIDSLIENDKQQKYIVKTIEEGTIRLEKKTISAGEDIKKTDTVKVITDGGFGRYYTSNVKEDTLHKLMYHDNIDNNFYETYYYKTNNLIYAKVEIIVGGTEPVIYFKEAYYSNEKILFTTESPRNDEQALGFRVNLDLKEKGLKYLKEFLGKEN